MSMRVFLLFGMIPPEDDEILGRITQLQEFRHPRVVQFGCKLLAHIGRKSVVHIRCKPVEHYSP
jgi:hypothetical protein